MAKSTAESWKCQGISQYLASDRGVHGVKYCTRWKLIAAATNIIKRQKQNDSEGHANKINLFSVTTSDGDKP